MCWCHLLILFLFVLLCHAQCVNLFITCLNKKIRKVETTMSSSDAHIFMIFFHTQRICFQTLSHYRLPDIISLQFDHLFNIYNKLESHKNRLWIDLKQFSDMNSGMKSGSEYCPFTAEGRSRTLSRSQQQQQQQQQGNVQSIRSCSCRFRVYITESAHHAKLLIWSLCLTMQ